MRLHRRPSDNMPLLSLGETHAARFRRVFGYVGEIKLIKDEPTDEIDFHSPALLTIITKVWWRYGSLKAEQHDSWIWCRLLTFEFPHCSSRHLIWELTHTAFTGTALFDGSMETLVVGDPVAGLIEATSGSLLTAQLSGWDKTTAAEWKLLPPRSFLDDGPYGGLELNGDALATLPAIAAENFGHTHAPNVGYARLHGHKVPKYFDQPVGPDDARERASSSAARTSPERRLRERFYRKQAEKRATALAAQKAANRPIRTKAPPAISGFHNSYFGF